MRDGCLVWFHRWKAAAFNANDGTATCPQERFRGTTFTLGSDYLCAADGAIPNVQGELANYRIIYPPAINESGQADRASWLSRPAAESEIVGLVSLHSASKYMHINVSKIGF